MAMKPVGTAIQMVVGPIVSDSDFKTLKTGQLYNAAGLDIDLVQEKTDGTVVRTDITLTAAGGANDFTELSKGYYAVEITAAQNNVEGIAYLQGTITGGLVFESPRYDIVPVAVYDALVKATSPLGVNATQISGDATAADNLEADYDGTGYAKNNSTTKLHADYEPAKTSGASNIWSYANRGLTDKSGFSLDASYSNDMDAFVDKVYDELLSGHLINGSGGKAITDLLARNNPLDAVNLRAAIGLATANLDAQLSGIAGYIDTEITNIYNRIGAPAGASLASDIAQLTGVVTEGVPHTTSPSSGTRSIGSDEGGVIGNLSAQDDLYWNTGEIIGQGLDVVLTTESSDVSHIPSVFSLLGHYEGGPTHTIGAYLWDYNAGAWEASPRFTMGTRTTDFPYSASLLAKHHDPITGEMKVRLRHSIDTYNSSHRLYLNFVGFTKVQATNVDSISISTILSRVQEFLDVAISSRLPTAIYTTPLNEEAMSLVISTALDLYDVMKRSEGTTDKEEILTSITTASELSDVNLTLIRQILGNKTTESEDGTTITVYADDDTTVLGVFTWDPATRTRGRLQ